MNSRLGEIGDVDRGAGEALLCCDCYLRRGRGQGANAGSQQSDPTPTSNVARVLNQTAFTVANFRQAVVTACNYSINPTAITTLRCRS